MGRGPVSEPGRFDAAYYARHAEALGWGVSHRPEPFKLAFLREQVRGPTVLDLGCGPGTYAAALAGEGGLRRVIGADFSRELLRGGAPGTWHGVTASALALPLRDASVDSTLLLSVLEHLDDHALLAEAARVTRQRMIIQVPLAEPALLVEGGMLFSHWSDRSHQRVYTEGHLRDLVDRCGWRITVFVPAFPRDLQELYVRGLAVPEVVRKAVRAILKPLRRFSPRPPAEAFAVAEPS